MRKTLIKVSDIVFLYYLAWLVILFSPIWLPIWLAIKINKWIKDEKT